MGMGVGVVCNVVDCLGSCRCGVLRRLLVLVLWLKQSVVAAATAF